MKRLTILASAIVALLCGCAPKTYSYKVVFQNGSTEYFELNYKPKHDCKTIEYNGDTYFGVKSVELIR